MKTRKFAVILLILSLAFVPSSTLALEILRVTDIDVELFEGTAIIQWRTNRAASSRVHYGKTRSYGSFVTTNTPHTTDHELTLRDLEPDTLYNFQVRSVDSLVNVAESNNFSFRTEKFTDDDTPIISKVEKPYITGSTATITWETDIETSGKVVYGPNENYGRSARARSFKRGTKHEVTIRGLQPQSIYHFRVEAKARRGVPSRYEDITFKTTSFINPEKTKLTITNIEPADIRSKNLTPTSVTIAWKTNKPTTGSIRYGKDTTIRQRIFNEDVSKFNHELAIFELEPGTEYFYQIYTSDVFGKRVNTEKLSFFTPLPPPPLTPVPVRVLGIQSDQIMPIRAVKSPEDPKVYTITKGRKHHISSLSVLHSYGLSFKDVMAVSHAELNRYTDVTLLKTADSPVVYFVDEKRRLKKRILSETVFLSYPQNGWGDIVTVSQDDLLAYTETNLVKLPRGPAVYHINFVTQERKIFSTERAFITRGYSFNDIISINPTELNTFKDAGVLE